MSMGTRSILPVGILFLTALYAPQSLARDNALGIELVASQYSVRGDGDMPIALVYSRELEHRAGYGWMQGWDVSITVREGGREYADWMSSVDYRRDSLRHWWGWSNNRAVEFRYRMGYALSLERVSDGEFQDDRLQAGLMGGLGFDWQRRFRAELVADTTQHYSLLFTVVF